MLGSGNIILFRFSGFQDVVAFIVVVVVFVGNKIVHLLVPKIICKHITIIIIIMKLSCFD